MKFCCRGFLLKIFSLLHTLYTIAFVHLLKSKQVIILYYYTSFYAFLKSLLTMSDRNNKIEQAK